MTDAVDTRPSSSPQAEFAVGATVPPFVRPAGLETWNRYAAVNYEFVGIHMDDAIGQAAGYPGAFGMGNLLWSWMHNALESWLDGRGRLEHIEFRFRSPALKGDEITCSGVVTGAQVQADGSTVLELDVWAANQSGDKIAPGKARVRLESTAG
jgi:acyl dehydratase